MTAPVPATFPHLTVCAGEPCCWSCRAPLFNGTIAHRDGCRLPDGIGWGAES